jgi:hypothetical protein
MPIILPAIFSAATNKTMNTPPPTPSLMPNSPLHILPHILLPILLVLSYFPPPFRFRAPLFLALLALLQWACTTSPWPPNAGTTRALRYGLSSSWIFLLPTVERIVMHTPERDFFRVEDANDDEVTKKRKNTELVKEWSFAKLWRGMRLVCTPRAVGWNFASRSLNEERARIREARLAGKRGTGRWEFVVTCLTRAVVFYLVWDGIMLVERRVVFPPEGERWEWGWSGEELGRVAVVEAAMLGTVYCGMRLQFELAAAVGVGVGVNRVEVNRAGNTREWDGGADRE